MTEEFAAGFVVRKIYFEILILNQIIKSNAVHIAKHYVNIQQRTMRNTI